MIGKTSSPAPTSADRQSATAARRGRADARNTASQRVSSVWRLALPALVVAVAGCASTVPAQVTTFQQWPADAVGGTWRFEASPRHADSLEYSNYADQLRAAIGATGLVEAKEGQPARFRVSFDAKSDPVQVRGYEPYYDPFYGPWGPWGGGMWGSFGFSRGPWGFGLGMPLYPSYATTFVQGQQHSLDVVIREGEANKKVYESKAVNTSTSRTLPEVFPYLVRSIFDYFPDANGQVRDVRIPTADR